MKHVIGALLSASHILLTVIPVLEPTKDAFGAAILHDLPQLTAGRVTWRAASGKNAQRYTPGQTTWHRAVHGLNSALTQRLSARRFTSFKQLSARRDGLRRPPVASSQLPAACFRASTSFCNASTCLTSASFRALSRVSSFSMLSFTLHSHGRGGERCWR
jgi:hypothetical protein